MGGVVAIGLSGYAGVGKTAAALYLEKHYGFKRLHIAEPMRAMLAELMRANGISDEMIDRYLTGDLKDGVPIPELGDRTSRELQITLGTAWGRRCVHPDLWVDTWMRMAQPYTRVMNDSVRFPNEERAISNLGGFTVIIERPGYGPIKFKWGRLGEFLYECGIMWGVDDSERLDRLDPDDKITNDDSLHALYGDLDEVMASYRIAPIVSLTEA